MARLTKQLDRGNSRRAMRQEPVASQIRLPLTCRELQDQLQCKGPFCLGRCITKSNAWEKKSWLEQNPSKTKEMLIRREKCPYTQFQQATH